MLDCLLSVLRLKVLAALVLPTFFADAVRQNALAAVGAAGHAGGGKEVMGAALGGALLGVASFRIGHCCLAFGCSAGLGHRRNKTFDQISAGSANSGGQLTCDAGKRTPPRVG